VAGRDLGEGTRLAAATGAWTCFEDRVSVAGLACLKPEARSHLFYRMRIHRGRKDERRSMSEAHYAGLIAAAHHQLQNPLIVIWDDLNTHLSAAMHEFTGAHPDWLTVIELPSYAPELNPVEGAWANMKNGLGNLAACTADQLAAIIRNRVKRIQYRPELINGFLANRTHPRTRAAVEIRPRPFNLCRTGASFQPPLSALPLHRTSTSPSTDRRAVRPG